MGERHCVAVPSHAAAPAEIEPVSAAAMPAYRARQVLLDGQWPGDARDPYAVDVELLDHPLHIIAGLAERDLSARSITERRAAEEFQRRAAPGTQQRIRETRYPLIPEKHI